MSARGYALVVVQKRQVRAWIEVDPQVVQFSRPLGGVVPDGAGGRITTMNMMLTEPQRCRFVPTRSRSSNQVYVTPFGQLVSTRDATLVGYPTMDVQINDQLTWQDQAFQVTFIYSDRRWMTEVQLDLMGETSRSTI